MQEVTLYSAKDLESAVHTLNKTQESLTRGKEGHSPHLLKLLEYRLATCRRILAELQDALAGMSPELVPIHEQLISILRSISAANTRQKVNNLGCAELGFLSLLNTGIVPYY